MEHFFDSASQSIINKDSVSPIKGAVIQEDLTLETKLQILSDAAKYDVACTSSGVSRKGKGAGMGNTEAAGICHTFGADGRCISLLKILMTNECIYDCKYCLNRSSNDVLRATFTPDEICTLTIEFYRRGYIEGLFLSSGILQNPNYTMERIYEVLYKLRIIHKFNGYIHIKGIPGVDPVLLEQIGYLCDRMSVNLELPTAKSLSSLAPNKTRQAILKPMKHIQVGIHNNRLTHGITNKKQALIMEADAYDASPKPLLSGSNLTLGASNAFSSNTALPYKQADVALAASENTAISRQTAYGTTGRYFVPAGQSTQMIIGGSKESDYELLSITQALYQSFDLKRVFFSAYIPLNDDAALPSPDTKPPLLREHRLYQADWLLRFYGFNATELLSEKQPFFNEQIDPKCDWAIRHLEKFPIEVTKAGYYELLRIPGIGVKSAKRIIATRKECTLDYPVLKKLGVVLKRAQYFITCNGRMLYHIPMNEQFITNQLIYSEKPFLPNIAGQSYYQPTLFDYGMH